MHRERIVVIEGLDERDVPVREPAPPLQLMPMFEPIGAGRGEWERAREVEVEYLAPGSRDAYGAREDRRGYYHTPDLGMTTDDRPRTIRDGLVPLGPGDTYNGVKVSSFCMTCRDAIARYEHGMQESVTLCDADSAKVIGAMSSTHVVGGKPEEFYRMAEVEPVPDLSLPPDHPASAWRKAVREHPAPWSWGDSKLGSKDRLLDANGEALLLAWRTEDTTQSYRDVSLVPASNKVKALLVAAPEMEALLRELVPHFDPLPEDIDPGLGLLLTKALFLVKRIDAAKGG